MKIGIIGSGQIGGALASHFTKIGHTVRISNSRGPESLSELAKRLNVTPVPAGEAARQADVLVVTIPTKAVPDLPDDLLRDFPERGIIVDTCNYYPWFRDGQIEAIDNGLTSSEWVAQQLGRPVVKVFNNIMARSLVERALSKGNPDRIALPVAGDQTESKAEVMSLLDAIGFDGYDAGTLAESWRQQPGTPVYCTDHTLATLPKVLAAANRSIELEMSRKQIESFFSVPPNTPIEETVRRLRSLWSDFGR